MSAIQKCALALCACLLLSACNLTPTKPTTHTAKTLNTWQAKGKLGIVANNKAKSVSFDWSHKLDDFDIKLHGTLGFGSARLKKDAGMITLKTNKGERYAYSADELLAEIIGWSVPVNELTYWIKGVASPESPVEDAQFDDAGNLSFLKQQGWEINYRSHHDLGNLQLPKKMIAKRQGLKLTVAVKSWRY